jgi:hypothetical protein
MAFQNPLNYQADFMIIMLPLAVVLRTQIKTVFGTFP